MKQYHDKLHGLDELTSYYKDYAPITNVDVIEKQCVDVYNLSVEDVHSYTLMVVVHNCYSRGFVKKILP